MNMADVEQDAAGNGSDTVNGTAGRFVSSPEGTALAYGSLLLMALLPIFFGALKSVCSKSKVNMDCVTYNQCGRMNKVCNLL